MCGRPSGGSTVKLQRLGPDDGAVIVEFALIFPILILLVAGVIQFGIMYSQYQVLQGAAREGARCASVQATDFGDCDVETKIEDAALGYTLSQTPTQNRDCTDATRGQDVTVSWEQQLDTGVLGTLVPPLPDAITTNISGTFRCE
jgi:Flp pilus assembly protein TadG